MFSLAPVYRLAQQGIGATRFRDVFANEILHARADDRVLDIGCGTADILDHLPELDYIGFDHNARYVESAAARYGGRGQFSNTAATDFTSVAADRSIAMAIGVLHHLDDDTAGEVLDLAARSLRPGGRFVSIDPTLVDGQARIARLIVSQDRGQHVRSPGEVADLFDPVFESVAISVRHDLLRVPYSHVVVEASLPRPPAERGGRRRLPPSQATEPAE